MHALMQIRTRIAVGFPGDFYACISKLHYMNVLDSMPVLGVVTIEIVGLQVFPLDYLGYRPYCSLNANSLSTSMNSALRTPVQIEVGPDCNERPLENIFKWQTRKVWNSLCYSSLC